MQYKHISLEDIEQEYDKYIIAFKPTMKRYLDVTVNTILKYAKDSVIAIYLIGSFGRGEGALYVENGRVKPLRDFDVLIVTAKPIKPDVIIAMTEEIHNKLGIPPPTRSFLEEFSIWITYVLFNVLVKGAPLLKYYELKHASTHLYGIDIRPLIDLKLDEVSLYNGILILLTKVEGFLTLYPLPNIRSFKRLLNFVYEVLKMYTEVSTAFSLIDKIIYRPRFSERCYNFVKVYKERAPWIFKLMPGLDHYVISACKRRKLLIKDFIIGLDLDTMKKHVIETLDKLISLYIALGYSIRAPLNGFSNSDTKILDRIGLITLADFFKDYLRKEFKVRSELLAKILGLGLAPLHLSISNISFVLRVREDRLPVKIRLIFSTKNHFVRLAHMGMITLKLLVYGKENEYAKIFSFLEKYLDKNYVKNLKRNGISIAKLRIAIKLLAKLIRLADASLHRKAI